MRIGGRLRLFRIGPFSESLYWTNWRSKRRTPVRPYYSGTLGASPPDYPREWKCPHHHGRPDLAVDCADREIRRRKRVAAGAP